MLLHFSNKVHLFPYLSKVAFRRVVFCLLHSFDKLTVKLQQELISFIGMGDYSYRSASNGLTPKSPTCLPVGKEGDFGFCSYLLFLFIYYF